jgi:hypothetical protein
MRVGLLTRFWGSLGVALGAVSFVFFQFTLLWFIYLGLLLIARVPGGKPPAWKSGESIPWPTPGDRAAADMAAPLEDDQLPSSAEDGQPALPSEDDQLTSPAEDPEQSSPTEKGQSQQG